MDRDFLYHVQDVHYANPLDARTAIIRVRARRGEGIDACEMVISGRDDAVPMRRMAHTTRHDLFEARVAFPPEGLLYTFRITVGASRLFFTKYGIYPAPTPGGRWTFTWSERDVFRTPEWVKDAVFYQVFPERFANGDPSNDPPGTVPWDSTPEIGSFFGGDLQGVLDRLDYLEDLGVNAIYFNPLFAASTNHKYNARDYLQIDPHFGDTALLKRLVDDCHQRGIRVILDGVFNHVGADFWAFKDVVENGPESRYAGWFFVQSYPVRTHPEPTYACWWNIWELPKLNTDHPEVRQHILEVAQHWIRETGMDGWRLDVPEEVPQSFWRELRGTLKSQWPDAYIVGEIWHDGRPWLRGDQFDAVMNYPLREAILSLLGAHATQGNRAAPRQRDVAAYDAAVHQLLTDLPEQVVQAQFNLLGSHDTERMMTLLDRDEARVRLAFTLLLTAPGAPVIYYGDEVGMEGGRDPDCRRGFPWDGPRNEGLRDHVKGLVRLRRQHAAMRRGGYETVLLDVSRSLYAFRRVLGEESVTVVLNASDRPHAAEVDGRDFRLGPYGAEIVTR